MSNEYKSLRRRINSLSAGTGNKTLWYQFGIETTVTHTGGDLYQTPDEALSKIYADAHKKHARYIAVVSFPFNNGMLQGQDLGYSWSLCPHKLLTITPETFGNSFVCVFDEYGTGISQICYPEAKPEREYLDCLEARELRWINEVAGLKTVDEFKRRNEERNPELYQVGYLTSTEQLRQKYRDE